MKKYVDKNVYDAAKERIKFVFNSFERVYVSFSGGKDSSILLHLCLDYLRKRKMKRKIGVLFVDLEGQYSITIDFVGKMLRENADIVEAYWCCLPLTLRNAVSVFQPFWTCWDAEHRDKWVREYPDFPGLITEQNNPFSFFRRQMEFEEFVFEFGKWYSNGKKTACLVGIRSDESLNRYRTIKSRSKITINGRNWTTKTAKNVYNAYPIYDWTVKDVWVANAKFGWAYNRLYDMLYKAGVPFASQRICQPYGDDQRKGLNLYRAIEPDTWARVVNRVSGANFGNIYCGNRILGYRNVRLPKGHTWKSYCKMLLATLPEELARHYRKKFKRFMLWWFRRGSPVDSESLKDLPAEAVITGRKSVYMENIVRYRRIPDCLDNGFEQRKLAPSWRRMCICILKNDHLCMSLSFSQTKRQQERMKELLEKYKSL
ncbi:MAG: phosphoadenosine phosphosulfate reductase [Verrucomicrobia bacterium]|nr:MAG: phosphoadenosine phosphosulfate reductase [Verrucomicrobiota bacterium]